MSEELKHNWRFDKILSVEEASTRADELRESGKSLVTVNGGFDLLHAGHLDILEEAKQQGDILFIGLNSDNSIREGKGEDRPIVSEQERAALLVALACVDYVVIIDESYDVVHDVLLETVKPDVHVNGEEYGLPEEWVDWPMMQKFDVKPHSVKRRPGLATSDIIEKIRK